MNSINTSLLSAVVLGTITTAGMAADTSGDAVDSRVVPEVYVIPLKGQMGTDIHPSIYEEIVEDVSKENPDIIVFELESADINKIDYLSDDDRREYGSRDIGQYRGLVKMLREELGNARQVMWVTDSVGFSSLVALAWEDIYINSNGRLGGLVRMMELTQHPDEEVRRKFREAVIGIGNGFLETGGRPRELGLAMMRPEMALSVSFKGRDMVWDNDTNGHWVVDGSSKRTASFPAQLAEDTGIAEGTADTLDDLVFLLGYREYVNNESGKKIVDDYRENWRRTFERCGEWYMDYQQQLGWATGEDTVKYLGAAKNSLEKILAAMRKYPAIELRVRMEFGVSALDLEVEIEKIKEQLRGLKGSQRRGSGGRKGGGGFGGL